MDIDPDPTEATRYDRIQIREPIIRGVQEGEIQFVIKGMRYIGIQEDYNRLQDRQGYKNTSVHKTKQ